MVTREDFNTHMYAEIIAAIDRNDEDILNDAIASAEGQAAGYLSNYNVDLLFAAEDDDRDPTLLMYIKDLAAWHFINLGNPSTNMELRKTRYDDALAELRRIQAGKVIMKDWPTASGEEAESFFLVSSVKKRDTRW